VTVRRITQALLVAALALVSVLGVAGIASAAFTLKTPATAPLAVATARLQPPTNLAWKCPAGSWGGPDVSFTKSPSVGTIPDRGVNTLGYRVTYTYNGFLSSGTGTTVLKSTDVTWSGSGHLFQQAWTVTVQATYGNWITDAALSTITLTC